MTTGAAAALLTTAAAAQSPMSATKTALVPFDVTPFPYRGIIPEKNVPFMDVVNGERHGHTAPRGGVYWEDLTYSDRRVLLSIPRGFDPRRPAVIVVYLHGNLATLARDVRDRQQVPRQVAESGLNAVLVAPQFAVDAADSSSGQFWQPGVFAKFVNEAAEKLTRLYGDPRVRDTFAQAPVIIVAYSGGYNPAAYALSVGGLGERVRGVILLDGLFGEIDKYAEWLAKRPQAFFFTGYGKASRSEHAELQRQLADRRVSVQTTMPARLTPGSVTFLAANDDVKHNDFVTQGWVKDPLKTVLARVPGFPRTAATTTKTSPSKKR